VPAEERGPGGRRRRGGRGRSRGGRGRGRAPEDAAAPAVAAVTGEHRVPTPAHADVVGVSGERLTRVEAFDLIQRSVAALVEGDDTASASAVRHRAHALLARDSESLSERNFGRILKDAHDAGIIDMRRSGADFAIARAPLTLRVDDAAPAAEAAKPAAAMKSLGLRGRGGVSRGRLSAIPPELLSIGVVETPAASNSDDEELESRRGRKRAKAAPADGAAKSKRSRNPRAKKAKSE